MKKVNILWTSGWDSTFRLLQLVEMNVNIQPIYILDTGRGSMKVEIERMAIIKNMIIEKYPKIKEKILPTKFISLTDISLNESVSTAYKNLYKKRFFGIQADWIGRLSKEFDNLEHCVHLDDNVQAIIKNEVEEFNDEYSGKYYKISKKCKDKDLIDLFGSLRYPILNYTKLEMKRIAEEKGNIDILNKSWFCFTPIHSEPCGTCNPCKYAIDEGMEFRFSKKALKRYKNRKFYILARRVRNKISMNI